MEKILPHKNWVTNNGHGYLFEERGKVVFTIYPSQVPAFNNPVASGKRDNYELAMDAAKTAAKKHGFTIGTWSNLTSA